MNSNSRQHASFVIYTNVQHRLNKENSVTSQSVLSGTRSTLPHSIESSKSSHLRRFGTEITNTNGHADPLKKTYELKHKFLDKKRSQFLNLRPKAFSKAREDVKLEVSSERTLPISGSSSSTAKLIPHNLPATRISNHNSNAIRLPHQEISRHQPSDLRRDEEVKKECADKKAERRKDVLKGLDVCDLLDLRDP